MNSRLVNWLPPTYAGQALVGVEHRRPALSQGLLQRLGAEAGFQGVGQPPGQHVPAVPVHQRHQVEEATGHGQVGDVRGPHLVGPGDSDIPQQVGIDRVLRRPAAGARPPVDGPQPHGAHQPLHPLPAHPYPLPLQPGLHPSRPVEGRLQVLPVDLSHQGRVLLGGSPGTTVVDAGTAHPQQRALAHQGQGRVLPVHHLPPPGLTHEPDLSAKKSRSTFSWPISSYRRSIRASSFLAFCSLPLPKTPEAPSASAFFQA